MAEPVGTCQGSPLRFHLYHGNASLLAESLEVIQQTSAVILAALQLPVEEAMTAATGLAEVA